MNLKKQLACMMALSSLASIAVSTQAHAAETKEYQSNGAVKFIPSLDPTDPLDPENPNPVDPVIPVDPTKPGGPNPGTNGPLSIDYASSLDFGTNRISNKDQVYFARAQAYQDGREETPNYVQVTDNRGTNAGWTLTVTQQEQLKSTTKTLNDELTGAQITLANPTVKTYAKNVVAPNPSDNITLIPGTASLVASAKAGAGTSTWENYWGSVEEVDETDESGATQKAKVTKDVALAVPGSTPKDAVEYQTELLWTLTDVPGN